jgi:hypothetical protein
MVTQYLVTTIYLFYLRKTLFMSSLAAFEAGEVLRVEAHCHMGMALIVAAAEHLAVTVEPGDGGAILKPDGHVHHMAAE